MKTTLSIHTSQVHDCLKSINNDMIEINLQNKSKEYKIKMTNIVIKENCRKFGLIEKNIKIIFYGAFKINSKKPFNPVFFEN